jgi:hypothetical protein
VIDDIGSTIDEQFVIRERELMNLWHLLSSAFRTVKSPPERRLDGRSEPLLAASIKMEPWDERGWVTFDEAASLFSPKGDKYAFGEMDEIGEQNLSSFAARSDCRIELMPSTGRIYFIRAAPTK